jgi:hypothetical protein
MVGMPRINFARSLAAITCLATVLVLAKVASSDELPTPATAAALVIAAATSGGAVFGCLFKRTVVAMLVGFALTLAAIAALSLYFLKYVPGR